MIYARLTQMENEKLRIESYDRSDATRGNDR